MLAVFDLEGTLTQDEFWDQFPQAAGVTADAMRGFLPFRQAMEMRLAAVRPILCRDFAVMGDNILLRAGAKEAVQKLKEEGFEVAIASGAFDFLADRIAGELGVEHYVANKTEILHGYLAGFAEPLVDAEGKRGFVLGLQERLGFAREETAVIGDGANDLAMMEEAGLKIAFAAKEAVKEKADCSFEGGDWEGLVARLLQFRQENFGGR